eukprot:scaffold6007_cov183-Amphora_coffeaeformis.AAC.8
MKRPKVSFGIRGPIPARGIINVNTCHHNEQRITTNVDERMMLAGNGTRTRRTTRCMKTIIALGVTDPGNDNASNVPTDKPVAINSVPMLILPAAFTEFAVGFDPIVGSITPMAFVATVLDVSVTIVGFPIATPNFIIERALGKGETLSEALDCFIHCGNPFSTSRTRTYQSMRDRST